MALETLEILALILIAVAAIKLVILLISPQSWYGLIEKLYSKPLIFSIIASILAVIVLYFLLESGVTIVEILAICLFVVLLIAIGLAQYIDKLIPWVKEQNITSLFKQVWLYIFAWLLLLAWGVGEIFLG